MSVNRLVKPLALCFRCSKVWCNLRRRSRQNESKRKKRKKSEQRNKNKQKKTIGKYQILIRRRFRIIFIFKLFLYPLNYEIATHYCRLQIFRTPIIIFIVIFIFSNFLLFYFCFSGSEIFIANPSVVQKMNGF